MDSPRYNGFNYMNYLHHSFNLGTPVLPFKIVIHKLFSIQKMSSRRHGRDTNLHSHLSYGHARLQPGIPVVSFSTLRGNGTVSRHQIDMIEDI